MDEIIEYKIKQILKFGLFSVAIFYLMIHFIQDKDFTYPLIFFSFLYGSGVGLIFTLTDSPRFYSKSFILRNSVRISLLIILFSLLIFFTQFVFNGPFEGLEDFELQFFTTSAYIKPTINVLIVTFFLALLIEMERHLGNKFIIDFFFSKYKKPINEDRIVMFLDLKDSTTIAEKIGNKGFVEFVNLCYMVMSHSVIRSKAEILKYVGDEVILTWPTPKGLRNSRCVNFYFDYHSLLETYRDEFESRFGFFPVFKAGMHTGEVTAAFLGTLRKQKDYSGDVMNTTARIESICNEYNADLLISANLLKQLPKDNRFKYIKIGNIELKGKAHRVELMKVEKLLSNKKG